MGTYGVRVHAVDTTGGAGDDFWVPYSGRLRGRGHSLVTRCTRGREGNITAFSNAAGRLTTQMGALPTMLNRAAAKK